MPEVWEYAMPGQIRVSGDMRSKYWVGQLVRIVQQNNTKFFRIKNVAYTSGYTYLTLDGGGIYTLTTDPITEHQYSLLLAPKDFPLEFDLFSQYLTNARHDTTERHTPGTVVPIVQSIPSSGGSNQIPSAAAVRTCLTSLYKYYNVVNLTSANSSYWYPVVFTPDSPPATPIMFRILRSNAHEDGYWYGTCNLECVAMPTGYGHFLNGIEYANYETPYDVNLISYIGLQYHGYHVIVYLKGGRKYYVYSSTDIENKNSLGQSYTIDVGRTDLEITIGVQTNINNPPPSTPGGPGSNPESINWFRASNRAMRAGAAPDSNHYGRVGIALTNPSYLLQLGFDSAAKPSTNTWTVSSDRRAKNDIVDADLDRCLEIVRQLPLRHFRWKDEFLSPDQAPDRGKLGWIADEVEPFFPRAVRVAPFTRRAKRVVKTTDPETGEEIRAEQWVDGEVIPDFKYLDSDQIIAAMYGAVQRLIQIVETQQAEIDMLKQQIHEIRAGA
ncbi:MAG: tail fiber domain-containing protein [Methanothrix sp.]|nr:tail fiber domain-containing protein [Methanothrix sp.]MCX8207523.1 tail fiber domain-containing protein [Methanothrix sp.]